MIEDVLAVQDVFRDARKGERVSEEDILKAFQTDDIFKIASEIIRSGEIQLTTEQRRRFIEERRKQIADIISKQSINPQTKLPHPVTRILNAMEKAHVNIDPFRPARDQVQEIVSKISSIIPISMERVEIGVRVPIEYAGKVSSDIRRFANVKKEEWKTDSWICVIEIPAGMQSDVYQKLNDMTSGKVEVKILREKPIS